MTSEKGIQIGLSSITTERDEVAISGALVADQVMSHGILDRILSQIGGLRMGVCCVRRNPGLRGETWGTLFFVYSVRGHPPECEGAPHLDFEMWVSVRPDSRGHPPDVVVFDNS